MTEFYPNPSQFLRNMIYVIFAEEDFLSISVVSHQRED